MFLEVTKWFRRLPLTSGQPRECITPVIGDHNSSSVEPTNHFLSSLSFELNVEVELSTLQALEQIRRVVSIGLERFDEFPGIL